KSCFTIGRCLRIERHCAKNQRTLASRGPLRYFVLHQPPEVVDVGGEKMALAILVLRGEDRDLVRASRRHDFESDANTGIERRAEHDQVAGASWATGLSYTFRGVHD